MCWQYQISLEFLEAIQRMQIAERYRKYRPSVEKQGHAKQWYVVYVVLCVCS